MKSVLYLSPSDFSSAFGVNFQADPDDTLSYRPPSDTWIRPKMFLSYRHLDTISYRFGYHYSFYVTFDPTLDIAKVGSGPPTYSEGDSLYISSSFLKLLGPTEVFQTVNEYLGSPLSAHETALILSGISS